jgi:hypothetical protein
MSKLVVQFDLMSFAKHFRATFCVQTVNKIYQKLGASQDVVDKIGRGEHVIFCLGTLVAAKFYKLRGSPTEMLDCLRDFPSPQLLCSHRENEHAKSLSVEQPRTFEPFLFATFGAAEILLL